MRDVYSQGGPPAAVHDRRRSIDKRGVRRLFEQVLLSELAAIDQGLELFLGLGAASAMPCFSWSPERVALT
jgi:hypothetical protein